MSAETTNPGRRLRLFPALLVVAAVGLTSVGAQAKEGAERSAHDMVRETSNAMLALIEEAKGYAEDDPERFYQAVEDLLTPVVDFDSFARSVMAVHYRDATKEQRERFAETFRTGLVRTYAMALTEFENGEVVVIPPDRPPRNPARQTVKMEHRCRRGLSGALLGGSGR